MPCSRPLTEIRGSLAGSKFSRVSASNWSFVEIISTKRGYFSRQHPAHHDVQCRVGVL